MNKRTNPAALAAAEGRCVVSLRTQRNNRNHHLWLNNGCWWLHYTVHLPDYTKRRVRESLGTRDVEEARRRRDARLALLGRGGLGLGR